MNEYGYYLFATAFFTAAFFSTAVIAGVFWRVLARSWWWVFQWTIRQ